MKEFRFTIKDKMGIHARPAGLLVKEAGKYSCKVTIEKDGKVVDAKSQLQDLYEKSTKEVGEVNAAIFEVHQMMLDDPDYEDSVFHIIRSQEINAEYAVASTGDNFSEMFAAMEDDYMRERAADVKDISNRLIEILQGNEQGGFMQKSQ